MRKLKLQVQTTIDGFMAGTSGELDWAAIEWSDDLKNFVIGLTGPVDTILLGKNLAMGFIPYWTAALNEPVPAEGAKIFVETPKIVFSTTLNAKRIAVPKKTKMKSRITRKTLIFPGTPLLMSQWTRGEKIKKAKSAKKTGTNMSEIAFIPSVRITAAVL